MHQRSTTRFCAVVLVCAMTFGVGAALAPSAGAATDANRNYVRALYGDLLDRPDLTVNDAGIEFWANRLDTMTRTQVATGIQRGSSEYYGRIVDILYLALLDRDPDPVGRAFYVDSWRNRTRTLEDVVVILVSSNEYYQFNGGTDRAFVEAVYFDLLGRQPSNEEIAAGLGVVAASGRASLARRVETSNERRVQNVTDAYGTYLGRIPGDSERNYWVGRLANGLRSELFDVAILASSEYYRANS